MSRAARRIRTPRSCSSITSCRRKGRSRSAPAVWARWIARHTKLHRDVALKILPDVFALDGECLARFEREAQLLAALNHPHIAQVYGFEDASDSRALVMELVEGMTLADRIAREPSLSTRSSRSRVKSPTRPRPRAQGIIHRDLKPANIKVRTDGTVKVLGVASDGKRFLVNVLGDEQPAPSPITVITNWVATLR